MRLNFKDTVMTKLLRRFMLCRQGVTAIEYALIASVVALVIVTGVGTAEPT